MKYCDIFPYTSKQIYVTKNKINCNKILFSILFKISVKDFKSSTRNIEERTLRYKPTTDRSAPFNSARLLLSHKGVSMRKGS